MPGLYNEQGMQPLPKKRGWSTGAIAAISVAAVVTLAAIIIFLSLFIVQANRYSCYAGRYSLQATHDIDFVVTWVDSGDAAWRASRDATAAQLGLAVDHRRYPTTAKSDAELQLVLESVHRFAPWVRRVFVVTARPQVPSLARFPKCTVVHHDALLPADALPTFNSHAIESGLHNIPDLAERFIYANDDMYATNHIFPGDYFQKGIPILHTITQPNVYVWDNNGFFAAWRNFCVLLGNHTGFATQMAHVYTPLTRSLMRAIWKEYAPQLQRLQRLRFRNHRVEDQYPPVGMAVVHGLDSGQVLRHSPNWPFTYQFQMLTSNLYKARPYSNTCINNTTQNMLDNVRQLLKVAPPRTRGSVIVVGSDAYNAQQVADLLLGAEVWWVVPASLHVQRVVAGLNADAGWEAVHWAPSLARLGAPAAGTTVVTKASATETRDWARAHGLQVLTFNQRRATAGEATDAYTVAVSRVIQK